MLAELFEHVEVGDNTGSGRPAGPVPAEHGRCRVSYVGQPRLDADWLRPRQAQLDAVVLGRVV